MSTKKRFLLKVIVLGDAGYLNLFNLESVKPHC